MDKNTIIGFLLIGLVLITFTWINRPSPEELAQKRMQDSIAQVAYIQQQAELAKAEQQKSTEQSTIEENKSDSAKNQELIDSYGVFANASMGEEKTFKLENELVELTFSNKGGKIISARLKEYTSYDSLPLMLFDKDEASFGLTLVTANNRVINTGDMFFEPSVSTDGKSLTMKLSAGEGRFLDFVYTLEPNDYMLRYEIKSQGLDQVLSPSTSSLDLQWNQKIRQQETGRQFEDRYTNLNYKYSADDRENLSDSKDDKQTPSGKLKWIAYKDQFFSTVLIADNTDFEAAQLESKKFHDGKYLKEYKTMTSFAFDPKNTSSTGFYYYFGPNDYKILKKYDKKLFNGKDVDLEKLVPLGASVFRYVNEWVILPVFDFIVSWCGNLGIAIFLLTLFIKMALFYPLTYKSLLSSAKMRVLRPQVEEINAKYPGQENAMTRQQKTMEFYRKAGANPMSGCLPMLLQMPFWIALFMFFPSAIELRHESFLWAKDLSTYDAVISWSTYIPLVSPYFGNHISLFCLLMTITNIIYTKYNMDQTNTGQQQMPGMKYMMYLMPLMMLVFLNNYPSGLNYYYFISMLITIIQTIAFRYFLNEDKLLAQMEENKKKPVKKGGFMARLEEAQRKQQELQRQQQRKGKK